MEESWDNFAVTWRNRASLNARASPYFISPRVSRKNTRKFFRDTINIIFQRLQYLRYGILFRTECTLLRSHSRIYSVATMRAHLRRQVLLCAGKYTVFIDIYTWEDSRFITSFQKLHRRRQRGRADFALFYRHRARKLRFFCARSRTPAVFPRHIHVQAAYIHLSRVCSILYFYYYVLILRSERFTIIVYSL